MKRPDPYSRQRSEIGFDVFYGSPKLRTLRVQPGDAERIREVLEEWASAEVSFNYVFEES